jgi:nucleoid-associated protein YgaU
MVSSSSQSSLSPAELVADRIADTRFFEARFLFNKFSADIAPEQRLYLQEKIDRSFRLFEQVFTRAEQLEYAGRLNEAAVFYEQAAAMVLDHPHLSRARQRLENHRQLGLKNKQEGKEEAKKDKPVKSGETICGEEIVVGSGSVTDPEIPPVKLSSILAKRKLVLIGSVAITIIFLVFGYLFLSINNDDKPVIRGAFIPGREAHGEDRLQDNLLDTDSSLMEVIRPNLGDTHVNIAGDGRGGDDTAIIDDDGGAYTTIRFSPGILMLIDGRGGDDTAIIDDGTYTVQSGDTLGSIAVKVYGVSWKWQEIYELNRDRLSSPTSLQVGQRLLIKKEVPVYQEN